MKMKKTKKNGVENEQADLSTQDISPGVKAIVGVLK